MTVLMAIALLATATYALRVSGVLIPMPGDSFLYRLNRPLTVAILASLVITNSFTTGTSLVLDARVVGISVAVVASLARLPVVVTMVLAVVATAAVRLIWHGS